MSSGLSGWESLVTTIANVAIPAYGVVETAKAQKTAAESAATTARLQQAVDMQKLALEQRLANMGASSASGGSSKIPLYVGGAVAAGLLLFLLVRRS